MIAACHYLHLIPGANVLQIEDFKIDLAAVAADLGGAPRKVALLLGTEGAGLSERWSSQATTRVTIPMAAGIDSLNVAAAAAIACYVLGQGPRQSSSSSSSRTRGETGQSAG